MAEAPMTSQAELDALACAVLPRQGHWSDEAYLRLTDECPRLVEFTDGYVEQLPTPTSSHQAILLFLYRLRDHTGSAVAPYPIFAAYPKRSKSAPWSPLLPKASSRPQRVAKAGGLRSMISCGISS